MKMDKHFRPYDYQETADIERPDEELIVDSLEVGDYIMYVVTSLEANEDDYILYYGLIYKKSQGQYIYQSKLHTNAKMALCDLECILSSGGYYD